MAYQQQGQPPVYQHEIQHQQPAHQPQMQQQYAPAHQPQMQPQYTPAHQPQMQTAHQPQMQPAHQPQMQPAHQPQMQPQHTPAQNVHNQEWQNGLCDCGPCDLCILSTFLPCVLLGKTSERMRDPSLQTYESMNSDCMVMCGITWFTGCGWIYAMMKRGEIRERFGIKGSGSSDCCTAYWCSCCALIQQEKEVQVRTASGPITQAYQAPQQGMQMPTGKH